MQRSKVSQQRKRAPTCLVWNAHVRGAGMEVARWVAAAGASVADGVRPAVARLTPARRPLADCNTNKCHWAKNKNHRKPHGKGGIPAVLLVVMWSPLTCRDALATKGSDRICDTFAMAFASIFNVIKYICVEFSGHKDAQVDKLNPTAFQKTPHRVIKMFGVLPRLPFVVACQRQKRQSLMDNNMFLHRNVQMDECFFYLTDV